MEGRKGLGAVQLRGRFIWAAVDPCDRRLRPQPKEFQQVVAEANERQFLLKLLQASQQELPEHLPSLAWLNADSICSWGRSEAILVCSFWKTIRLVMGG